MGEWERSMAQEGISQAELVEIACEGSGDVATAAELKSTLESFNRADYGHRNCDATH